MRELKRSHTSLSGHNCIKNVWRPGSARTRWGSLSAPPDSLAAVGRKITLSIRSLVPIAGEGRNGSAGNGQR